MQAPRVPSTAVAERIPGGRPVHSANASAKAQHSFGWARAAPWRGNPHVAHLVLGERVPSDASTITSCLRTLRRSGYSTVVTTAMAPGDARPFVDAGFDVRERLHLLEHDLADLPTLTPRSLRLRRAWRTDRPAVLALDRLAFDEFWRLEELGLREALHATPTARFRIGDPTRDASGRGADDPPRAQHLAAAAYAITGRAGRQGYLQRIAVHPDERRQGWGRILVLDALVWLRHHDVRRALVNTQWVNDGAIALYESCGFRRLPVGLSVLDRTL